MVAGFTVENRQIVGHGISTTGRTTKTRATLTGAAIGAWWGLFIGLLLGLTGVGRRSRPPCGCDALTKDEGRPAGRAAFGHLK
ncbi:MULTISPECIES: hypothetical protein [Nocardia]|uniref:hypothetical protein n=1 Tax=Nocardia TaxID=1817 RepID=UPI0002FCFB00|nr:MULTISPECIES: hypothetical protein [Nocardia]